MIDTKHTGYCIMIKFTFVYKKKGVVNLKNFHDNIRKFAFWMNVFFTCSFGQSPAKYCFVFRLMFTNVSDMRHVRDGVTL